MTKDKLEEIVERVTEAILREARENGADSPMDRGDAEQLATAALNASGLIAENERLRSQLVATLAGTYNVAPNATTGMCGNLDQSGDLLASVKEMAASLHSIRPSDTGATE